MHDCLDTKHSPERSTNKLLTPLTHAPPLFESRKNLNQDREEKKRKRKKKKVKKKSVVIPLWPKGRGDEASKKSAAQ